MQHVTRRFERRVAVDDLTFDVRRGEVFALVGPNGAGKTTTLRLLAGLIAPSMGTIQIDGKTMTNAGIDRVRGRIGYLPETPGLWDHLTVEDNLIVYARLFRLRDPAAAAQRVLRLFDLWDRRTDRTALLSKGMKQKLALARALVHDPELVLLDEPTANLDPETSRSVRDLLRSLGAEGRAVVVSTHNLDEVDRIARRVALIRQRLVAIGEPDALRTKLFGRRLRIKLAAGTGSVAALASVATRAGGRDVTTERDELSLVLDHPDDGGPAVVRALVEAGAGIRAVFDEQAPLEEVYLRLLDDPHPDWQTATTDSASPRSRPEPPSIPLEGSARVQPDSGIKNKAAALLALLGKELRELRAAPAAVLPVAILAVVSVALPFVLVPHLTDVPLADDRSLRQLVALTRARTAGLTIATDAPAEAFLFQQFLILFILTPIVGAVSFAAYTVVGEKQARTLEPLLTTPLTTADLLLAKVAASLLPSLLIEAAAVCVYVVLVRVLAPAGVWALILTPGTVMLLAVVGPVAALAALQSTIAVSSRVNDPRSAQQIAVLLVLPLVIALFGQLAGTLVLTARILLLVAVGLALIWGLLVLLSVALFQRETILTRWK